MTFELTDVQTMLQATVRRQLEHLLSDTALRNWGVQGPETSRAVWTAGIEQGWPLLLLSEPDGGAGLGAAEMLVLHEELGRALAPGPWFVNVGLLAGLQLMRLGGKDLLGLQTQIGAGSAVACLVESRSGFPVPIALASGERDPLSKADLLIEHPELATDCLWLQASAAATGNVHIRCAWTSTSRLSKTTLSAFDPVHPLASVTVAELQAHGTTAFDAEVSGTAWQQALALPHLALCAEAVGVASRSVEEALRHATERRQFGHAIGSFQSVKHVLVDAALALECARAAARHAALLWDEAPDTALLAIDAARIHASRLGVDFVSRCLHIFGATGFTWDCPLHLCLRRAQRLSNALGGAAPARRRVGESLRTNEDYFLIGA